MPRTELPSDFEGDSENIYYEPKIKVKQIKKTFTEKISLNETEKLDKLIIDAQKVYQKASKGGESNRIIYIGYESLKINVSPLVIDRVLLFLNSFILNIRKIGGEIKFKEHTTFVIIDGEEFSISIREKQSRVEIKDSKYSWNTYDNIASGILFFKIGENSWNSKEWKDTANTRLEDKLIDIIEYLKIAVIEVKEERKKREQRRIEEEKQRLIKVDFEKRRSSELANFITLKEDSEIWEKSRLMRRYLDEIERFARERNNYEEELEKYLIWARKKLDWYDPLINKDDELLNDVDKKTLAVTKKGRL